MRNTKYGFTLIELLVVISVIALLLAILMPALRKARMHAWSVMCSNNIKSQYLVQVLYANDFEGKFAKNLDQPEYALMGCDTEPGWKGTGFSVC